MQLTLEQEKFVRDHEQDDVRDLALRFSREDMPFLLVQIAGRQMAAAKIPSWHFAEGILYAGHISLEQASSEATARYKASLLPEGKELFVDLTGGLGVDFSFLSPHFRQSVYVEQNEELCRIVAHNFALLGLKNAAIKNESAEVFLQTLPKADVIYLDPSRRDGGGRKVFRIEDCSPDITKIRELLLTKSDVVLVKFSPMLDISLALKALKYVREVHVVSVDNECRELLFLLSGTVEEEPLFIAVNLRKTGEKELFSFTVSEEQQADSPFSNELARYLYEPNASILKAGAFKSIAQAYDILKLHVNSHLYTSDRLIPDFPGRVFEITSSCAPSKRKLKSFLAGMKKANISVRNFPMSVAEIRKKTGLKDGGDIYLFATTLADGQKVWIACRKALVD